MGVHIQPPNYKTGLEFARFVKDMNFWYRYGFEIPRTFSFRNSSFQFQKGRYMLHLLSKQLKRGLKADPLSKPTNDQWLIAKKTTQEVLHDISVFIDVKELGQRVEVMNNFTINQDAFLVCLYGSFQRLATQKYQVQEWAQVAAQKTWKSITRWEAQSEAKRRLNAWSYFCNDVLGASRIPVKMINRLMRVELDQHLGRHRPTSCATNILNHFS